MDDQEKILEYEKKLIEKKLNILEEAYRQLDRDRKQLERERKAFEAEKVYEQEQHSRYQNNVRYHDFDIDSSFFKGVNNILALKKRYRDLCRIFHPDNLCGDTETFTIIKNEFECLYDMYNRNEA